MTELYEWARIVNVPLAAFVFFAGLLRVRAVWNDIAANLRLKAIALAWMAFGYGYGSLESLMLEVPTGSRTLIGTTGLVIAAVSSLLPQEFQHRFGPKEGADADKPK